MPTVPANSTTQAAHLGILLCPKVPFPSTSTTACSTFSLAFYTDSRSCISGQWPQEGLLQEGPQNPPAPEPKLLPSASLTPT